jgi:carbon-monoxide dehydrogenase large subunit
MTAAIIPKPAARTCRRRWEIFPHARKAAREQGRYIGIGLCNYVEGTGRGPFESASVRVEPSGRIVVATRRNRAGPRREIHAGAACGGHFGARPEDIRVIDGDTAATPLASARSPAGRP